MITVAICDDSAQERETMRSYVETYCKEKIAECSISTFESAEDLINDKMASHSDAILLDIYMNGMDGMTCAKLLRDNGYTGCFVFITTSREHAIDGYAVEALDYLTKPVTYPRMCKAMNRVFRNCEGALTSITVSVDGKQTLLLLRDIYYIETGNNHNTLLHLTGGIINSTTLISDIDALLQPYPNFLRCHRSYLINMNYVERVDDGMVIMQDGSHVLLPVRRLAETKRQIIDYLRSRMMEEFR